MKNNTKCTPFSGFSGDNKNVPESSRLIRTRSEHFRIIARQYYEQQSNNILQYHCQKHNVSRPKQQTIRLHYNQGLAHLIYVDLTQMNVLKIWFMDVEPLLKIFFKGKIWVSTILGKEKESDKRVINKVTIQRLISKKVSC